ncbi:MAG: AAA-like domain-containing protein, partial [Lachnospiraceae bacterium]|nr:AAA-like domain-containing protein [Lachnospiraceae bacterium]
MKKFNTTGVCIPAKHYMVNIDERLKQIKGMIDEGDYFVINRARQYGKTTTLTALKKYLAEDYLVISLDFQEMGSADFATENNFVQAFCGLLMQETEGFLKIPEKIEKQIYEYFAGKVLNVTLHRFFMMLREWCAISEKKIVLLIDEVDSASNNQVFLDFLAQLRAGYIARDTKELPAFQSVILVGVTDIRYLKSKIREEEQVKVNSQRTYTFVWNIAADFQIDMSLSAEGIRGMLEE